MSKEELLALLRLCNADPSAIDAVEMAYELGFKAGLLASLDQETHSIVSGS
jgi:hypothetical protein